jgi:hypothetical protein
VKDNIHRINDIIKQVPDLRYDCSAGIFETDRRALYDFAVLVVRECADLVKDDDNAFDILKHFGVEE